MNKNGAKNCKRRVVEINQVKYGHGGAQGRPRERR